MDCGPLVLCCPSQISSSSPFTMIAWNLSNNPNWHCCSIQWWVSVWSIWRRWWLWIIICRQGYSKDCNWCTRDRCRGSCSNSYFDWQICSVPRGSCINDVWSSVPVLHLRQNRRINVFWRPPRFTRDPRNQADGTTTGFGAFREQFFVWGIWCQFCRSTCKLAGVQGNKFFFNQKLHIGQEILLSNHWCTFRFCLGIHFVERSWNKRIVCTCVIFQ